MLLSKETGETCGTLLSQGVFILNVLLLVRFVSGVCCSLCCCFLHALKQESAGAGTGDLHAASSRKTSLSEPLAGQPDLRFDSLITEITRRFNGKGARFHAAAGLGTLALFAAGTRTTKLLVKAMTSVVRRASPCGL